MKNLLTFDEFINESEITQTKEIDIDQFPNPITHSIARIFMKKGEMDGNRTDDIIKTKLVMIPAKELKPSQNAVYLNKSIKMAVGEVEGGDLGAIISKDNYILDGHHRWASTMFNDPNAKIKGFKSDLSIADLIPVLRALGDVFKNGRRGEPKGGDKNIFQSTQEDILNLLETIDNGEGWLNKIGGEKELQKRLNLIKLVSPPKDAPDRDKMPVIDADKGEDKKAADLLNQGKIDVKTPYA